MRSGDPDNHRKVVTSIGLEKWYRNTHEQLVSRPMAHHLVETKCFQNPGTKWQMCSAEFKRIQIVIFSSKNNAPITRILVIDD